MVGAGGAPGSLPGDGGEGGHRTEFSSGSVWAIAGGGGAGAGAGDNGDGGYGGSTNVNNAGTGNGPEPGAGGQAGVSPNVGGAAGQSTGGDGQAGTDGGVILGGSGGSAPGNGGDGGSGGDGAGGGGGGASGGSSGGGGGGGGAGASGGSSGGGGGGGGAGASGSSTTNVSVEPAPYPGPGNGGAPDTAGTDGFAEITALNPAVVRTVAGNQKVTVSWTEPTQPSDVGTVTYTLYRDGVPVSNVTGTSKTITGLTNGKRYTFTVVASATDLSTRAGATATPRKDPQQQPSGAIPKKLKNKGNTVVNKRRAVTVQGRPVTARVRQVSQLRGERVCWRAIRGPQRKLTIRTTGHCSAKLRIIYSAPASDRYFAYSKSVTYKIKRVR